MQKKLYVKSKYTTTLVNKVLCNCVNLFKSRYSMPELITELISEHLCFEGISSIREHGTIECAVFYNKTNFGTHFVVFSLTPLSTGDLRVIMQEYQHGLGSLEMLLPREENLLKHVKVVSNEERNFW